MIKRSLIILGFTCHLSGMVPPDVSTITHVDQLETALEPYFTGYHPSTIVVFDIDNTLGTLYGDLRLDPSVFNLNVALLRKMRPEAKDMDPFEVNFGDLLEMYRDATMHPLERENKVRRIIASLQRNNIPVILLTARSGPLKEATQIHITEHLRITPSDLSHGEEITFCDISAQVLFSHGILYCGSNRKGSVLRRLFERLGCRYNDIKFADDDPKNIIGFIEDFQQDATVSPFLMQVQSRISSLPTELQTTINGIMSNIEYIEDLGDVPPYLFYPSNLRLILSGLQRGSATDLRIDVPEPGSHEFEVTSPRSCSPYSHMPLSCPTIPQDFGAFIPGHELDKK